MLASLLQGLLWGWLLAYWLHFRKTDMQLFANFMNRVVNMEAIEERERMLKVRMARQGLKSTRLDSGPNARVTKMRVRKRR
jgi:hypothetical protein